MDHPLANTIAAIEKGVEQNLHPGAQLYIWRRGQVLADLGIGDAAPGVAMTADHLLHWMSGTKPVVAAAVMQCIERGLLSLDDPVARHLPEFASHGKDDITLWHLLTHTAGLRRADARADMRNWEQIIATIAAAEPEWPAGQKAGYHIASSWFLLGEIVRRVDGRPIDQYLRESIFAPLGMDDSHLALDAAGIERYGQRLAMTYRTDGHAMTPDPNSIAPAELSIIRPGSSGRGPARELGGFYEMLLGGGVLSGARVLEEASVREMTRRQRIGMLDQTFRQVMDWGLGLIINSAHQTSLNVLPYNFGPGASPDAFGHGGAQSSISFADPARELVVVILFNGMPGEPRHHARMHTILRALWQDLEG